MFTPPVSSRKPFQHPLVEIVDADNRSLGAMPLDEARRQHLFHRMVLVLLYDQSNRLYLKQQKGHGASTPCQWDIGLVTYLSPGESTKDGARRNIHEGLGRITGRLRCVRTLPPSSAIPWVFTSLYRLHTSRIVLQREGSTILGVDQDEMAGLVNHCPDLLTQRALCLYKQSRLFDDL